MSRSHPDSTIRRSDLDKLAQLGFKVRHPMTFNNFGAVYHGMRGNQQCAFKVFNMEALVAQLKHEPTLWLNRNLLFLLKTVKHRNLVQVYDIYYLDDGKLVAFMELLNRGSLFTLFKQSDPFDEETASLYYRQIGKALEYLHSLGIAHRNIKPENVLIHRSTTQKLYICKLADFGYGELTFDPVTGKQCFSSSFSGTLITMAPEVIEEKAHSPTVADVWSSGVVLYYMMHADYPFTPEPENLNTMHAAHVKGNVQFRVELTPHARRYIMQHLVVDPKDRTSMKELMQDVWFEFVRLLKMELDKVRPKSSKPCNIL